MAERVMVVCDVCGAAPAETVAITAKDRSYRKDLCSTHLSQLLEGARAPRRGRPRKAEAASSNAAPQAAPRRRGRPPKSAATQAAASKPTTARKRGPITDPVILQKRRDALAKARAARAAKRAAAAKS
jgi:hypothetical protein